MIMCKISTNPVPIPWKRPQWLLYWSNSEVTAAADLNQNRIKTNTGTPPWHRRGLLPFQVGFSLSTGPTPGRGFQLHLQKHRTVSNRAHPAFHPLLPRFPEEPSLPLHPTPPSHCLSSEAQHSQIYNKIRKWHHSLKFQGYPSPRKHPWDFCTTFHPQGQPDFKSASQGCISSSEALGMHFHQTFSEEGLFCNAGSQLETKLNAPWLLNHFRGKKIKNETLISKWKCLRYKQNPNGMLGYCIW